MKWSATLLLIILIYWSPSNLQAMTLEEGIKDPTLSKSWELLKSGHPSKALQQISKYQPTSENKIYYHFILGRALEAERRPLEAMEHYRSAYLSAPPDELKELALLERADGYYRIGNFYEAKLTYQLFLTSFKNSLNAEKANLGMARCLQSIGSLAQALPYYEKGGEGLEALFGRATLLQRLGRAKEAHEFFLKGLNRDKEYLNKSEELILYYGENLQQLGKDQEATNYLSKEIKNPILRKKADLILGMIVAKTGQFDQAKKYFDSALTSTDRQTKQEALFSLAEAQLTAGRKNEAHHSFQEYLQKYPSGKAAERSLMLSARLEMEGGQYDLAEKSIKKLILGSPPKKETLMELEAFFLKLKEKDPGRMVSLWKVVGTKLLDPSREPFLLVMTETLKGTGKPYFELLQWLATHGSEKVKNHSLIAMTRYRLETGQVELARANLISLKNSKNKISGDDLLRLEAHFLHSQGDYKEAYKRLLALKKVTLQDMPILENTVTSAKDVNKAIEFFEKNIKNLGGNSSSYLRIADLLHEKGRKKEALQYYRQALEKDPLNEWGLFRAGSLMDGAEGQQMLGRLKGGNSLLGKLAGISLKEKEVERKAGETL